MKRVLSGIQPSGEMHIGNYLGAVSQWISLQEEFDCFYCLVDLHAITVKQDPKKLAAQTLQMAKLLLALGVDPKQHTLFIQSHVPAHTELGWILQTFAKMGEMERMTQFKDKSKKHVDNINVGLFTYPVLMAADILLYQAQGVPVGIDQKQHVELTRDLAQRFNTEYGDTFVVPKAVIRKEGAKIYSLQDATKKMSKSDGAAGYIAMMDEPDVIRKKLKTAMTDSEKEIRFDIENKPAISNLLTIQSLVSQTHMDEVVASYEGKGYADFKQGVAESLIQFLTPIQDRVKEMSDTEVLKILQEGAKKASAVAEKTLEDVREKIGLI